MAPKRSCKGKKRSKKCPRSGKRSCSRVKACAKPSLFMDDIRWLQFKKAAMEAIAAAKLVKYTLVVGQLGQQFPSPTQDAHYTAYTAKIVAQNKAWADFYNSVHSQFITPKFLAEAKSELGFAIAELAQFLLASLQVPLGTKAEYFLTETVKFGGSAFVFHYVPFSVQKLIDALKGKAAAVSTALTKL
jgi:hypothetical protein